MSSQKLAVLIPIIATLALQSTWGGEGEVEPESSLPDAAPVYDDDPSHLWNQIHQAFFHRSNDGVEMRGTDTVDPPLWPDTSGFLRSGPSHRNAIAVLDHFLSTDGQALITDPTKRAVLQHDLWSVFDWCATSRKIAGVPDTGLADLRSRLALAIQRLALSAEEIAALPDNFRDAVASGTYRPDFDPDQPRAPFLPPDLLDPNGPWVCVRGAFAGPSAPVHVEYYQGRSPFLVFIQLPGGRKATLNYVNDLNRATNQAATQDVSELPQFPIGTKAALLRQMAVIDASGGIQVTPLVQTLQMRVYRQVGPEVTDHQNSQAVVKFHLSRAGLFEGRDGGLDPVGWDEPLGISLLLQNDIYDREKPQSGIRTVMQSCVACHSCGGATIHSVFTYKQDDWVRGANLMAANRLRLITTNPLIESQKTVNWKMERFEWGLLKGLLDRSPSVSVSTASVPISF